MMILKPFSGLPSIFLPVGSPPRGTCSFATTNCLSQCAALRSIRSKTKSDYIKGYVGYDFKVSVLNFLEQFSVDEITSQIVSETNKMYWFASGDCPEYLTAKLADIMLALATKGVLQCGFTRNKKLHNLVYANTKLVLTTERLEHHYDGNYLVAVPNYSEKHITIYKKGKVLFGSCDTESFSCDECLKAEKGCFSNAALWQKN